MYGTTQITYGFSQLFPLKFWLPSLNDMDSMCKDQFTHLCNLPFVYKHVAAMPDCHGGVGMPIGGVLATVGGILIPNAVGVDIGCGMCAAKYDVDASKLTPNDIRSILIAIKTMVPLGFNHHEEPVLNDVFDKAPDLPIVQQELEKSRYALGTIGGGNHFIELDRCAEDGSLWFVIHTGSRNLGKKICDYYNKQAQKLNAKWYSNVPPDWGLAFLPIDEPEGKAYYEEMKFAQQYAVANRAAIMSAIATVMKGYGYNQVDFIESIHNYAAMENHFGQNVFVHRKGAVRARLGERVIIGGSQGSGSVIAVGKGEKQSFESCSHGAGRLMGRKEAFRTLKVEDMQAAMGDIIMIDPIDSKMLDESPQCYKDLDKVVANESDLVDPLFHLKPIGVLKDVEEETKPWGKKKAPATLT